MHELFNDRYIGKVLPWHRLGTWDIEDMSAEEAFMRMGPYKVTLQPVLVDVGNGMQVVVPGSRSITRWPTNDDPDYKNFGFVSDKYELITPIEACRIWDKQVKAPIETMGALRDGANLFFSVKMPSMNIGGEEVQDFLLLDSPMTGKDALHVRRTEIAVVCMNTLQMARQMSSWDVRISHYRNAKAAYASALKEALGLAQKERQQVEEAFDAMAKRKINREELINVISITYPNPTEPERKSYESIEKHEERVAAYEKLLQSTKELRISAWQLAKGGMTGFELPTRKGTVWGAYNAISELESWRNYGKGLQAAQSLLDGVRANRIETAFDACVDLVKA